MTDTPNPELNLHPEAKKSFDARIDELKIKLRPTPDELKPKPAKPNPNAPVVAHFDDSNIVGEIKLSRVDGEGKVVCREFKGDGRMIGLYDEDHRDLVRLAENLQSSIRPKHVVSVETLEDLIFEWIKGNYRGETLQGLCDFVLAEAEKKIFRGHMWIPISNFHIPRPFSVGRVSFTLVTKAFMDKWEADLIGQVAKSDEDREAIQIAFKRRRPKVQGSGAAVVTIAAEPSQAYKNALEETKRSLAALRYFSHYAMVPTSVCYSAPVDTQRTDGYEYFLLETGKIPRNVSGISDNGFRPWTFSNPKLNENFKSGLSVLDDLLKKDTLTDFQEKLIEALLTYSKATFAKDLSDRLLYTMVALETLFLRDAQEPIQDNISWRMAFMQPVPVAERRKIIQNVKTVYGMRSKLVHHGQNVRIDDMAELKTFSLNAWYSVFPLIQAAATSITRHQFFEDLENRKVSG